ncbi:hypothetical protein T07_10345 [Trichinella nelsoni]|uniref:Uncharacterized protein n=1 Tax=Trichinella nelsoni TaxID=6336 RepID=A0A0V0RAV4_9BILA|nr:hypothetical protein T07_10345 [Trichinella nelsoni]
MTHIKFIFKGVRLQRIAHARVSHVNRANKRFAIDNATMPR